MSGIPGDLVLFNNLYASVYAFVENPVTWAADVKTEMAFVKIHAIIDIIWPA